MKNRITILLSLTLFIVLQGSVKAQNPFYPLDNYNPGYFENGWPGRTSQDTILKIEQRASDKFASLFDIGGSSFPYPYPYVFGGCTHILRFDLSQIPSIPDSSYIWFESYYGSDDFPNDIGNNVSLTSEKFLIRRGATFIDMPFQTYRVPDDLNMKIFSVIVYLNQQPVEFFPFHFINELTYSIKYIPPTVLYSGILEVNINDATGNAVYSLNGGQSWKHSTDTATKSEIKNLTDYNVIYIKEPLSCGYIQIPIDELESPIIYREVFIPSVSNAILDKSPGKHYIPSRQDFTFTIQPTGGEGNIPFVHTDRTSIPDSEGVIIVNNGDGTFTVTIKHVQQNIKVSIDFITGNEQINQDNNIWVYNNQLYITTTSAEKAKIYNATGKLIKTIPIATGETISLPLPKGFYIVNIQDKSYKVLSK